MPVLVETTLQGPRKLELTGVTVIVAAAVENHIVRHRNLLEALAQNQRPALLRTKRIRPVHTKVLAVFVLVVVTMAPLEILAVIVEARQNGRPSLPVVVKPQRRADRPQEIVLVGLRPASAIAIDIRVVGYRSRHVRAQRQALANLDSRRTIQYLYLCNRCLHKRKGNRKGQ